MDLYLLYHYLNHANLFGGELAHCSAVTLLRACAAARRVCVLAPCMLTSSRGVCRGRRLRADEPAVYGAPGGPAVMWNGGLCGGSAAATAAAAHAVEPLACMRCALAA